MPASPPKRSRLRRVLRALALAFGVLLVAFAIFVAATWAPDRSVGELSARWAPPPSTFLEVNGLRVHVRDEGPRSDPTPIVLLHGTSASLHTWDGWAAALSPSRRVLRFDLPGFGPTGPSVDGRYTIDAYVEFVVGVLEAMGVKRCVLAGNSLGGNIAWETAVQHPARVERLVLVDAGGYPNPQASLPLAFRLAQLPVVSKLGQVILPRSVVESSVRNVYGDPSRVTPELVDRYYELSLRAGNRAAVVERFRQVHHGENAGAIARITAPTLILWGAKDRLVPPEHAASFHRDLQDSKLVLFDDLGHVPHEEDPERTVTEVRRFLE